MRNRVLPGFSVGLTITGIAWEWKSKYGYGPLLSCQRTSCFYTHSGRYHPLCCWTLCYRKPLLSHHLQSDQGLLTLPTSHSYS